MNEIKLRAWDKKRKEMFNIITWNDPSYLPSDFTAIGQSSDSIIQLDKKDTIITQFIGYKDKKGKDIFIGDILKWGNECVILIISTDELGFYYKILNQKDKNVIDFDIRFYRSEDYAKIIGNEFKNPEMIKKCENCGGTISNPKDEKETFKNLFICEDCGKLTKIDN